MRRDLKPGNFLVKVNEGAGESGALSLEISDLGSAMEEPCLLWPHVLTKHKDFSFFLSPAAMSDLTRDSVGAVLFCRLLDPRRLRSVHAHLSGAFRRCKDWSQCQSTLSLCSPRKQASFRRESVGFERLMPFPFCKVTEDGCLCSKIMTTLEYAGPEALEEIKYFFASDIWSCGVVASEILAAEGGSLCFLLNQKIQMCRSCADALQLH